MKAVIARIKNICWKAFGIVSTLRDSLSEKKPAALLVRFHEITRKVLITRLFYNAAVLQEIFLLETKTFSWNFPEFFKEANAKIFFESYH